MAKPKRFHKAEDESQNKYLPLFMQSPNIKKNFIESNDETVSNFRRALPQILAVNIQNLLQFGYGMTQGFPTIAIPAIQSSAESSSITLNKEQISWLSSINLICMPLGCLFSGMFAQYLGKRRAMQLVNLPMLAVWLLFYSATCTEHMCLALCFVGIGGGLMEAAFLLGSLMHWRTVAIVSTVIPLFSIAMLCFVPESPVWLIRERRFLDAVKALQWLRGWVSEKTVETEFKQLYDELITQKSARKTVEDQVSSSVGHSLKKKLHMWHKRSFVVPFLLVLLTFFICHFSGKTPIRSYAVLIFATLKAPMDKNSATILLGISELLATILGAVFIHSTGKRPLVFTSMLGTGACISGIAIYTHSLDIRELTGIETVNASTSMLNNSILHNGMASQLSPVNVHSYLEWIPLLLVLLAAFFANLGIRMIPWVLIGEMFPAEIRRSASGFAGCMGYLFGFLANKMFLLMISVLTLPGTFAFYACVSFIGIIILYFIMPETEGCTLGEIEAHFSKKSDVNLLRKTKNDNSQNDDAKVIDYE
ncbi:hypothetical protein ACLKA7_011558 [Drosophila subpalustris]